MHGPTCIFRANLTTVSLPAGRAAGAPKLMVPCEPGEAGARAMRALELEPAQVCLMLASASNSSSESASLIPPQT